VDNGNSVNANRIDAAAINLGGGALRLTGAETLGTVTAVAGTTQIIYNPTSETVATPLTVTGFTRQTGAVVQFKPRSWLGAVGQATLAARVLVSRILIPGQANVTGTADTIPGFFGNNNLDFIQYDGTTMDSGAPLGVRDARNPGSSTAQFAVPYVNDQAETSWSDATVLRLTTSPTLTANRALDAVKIEAANLTITQAANDLRIENGGIISATATATITSTTGRLYAGKAVATAGTAELFVGGNSAININSNITDNPLSGQAVALVKTGTNQLNLNNTVANTYSGGTYVNSGTLNTTTNNAFGSGPIYLNGGTLLFNIANAASAVALGGLGNNIEVNANSQITLDNGALAGTDNDLAFGSLRINGPYTLRLFSFGQHGRELHRHSRVCRYPDHRHDAGGAPAVTERASSPSTAPSQVPGFSSVVRAITTTRLPSFKLAEPKRRRILTPAK
jgi:autotransporter-associated beta strand protein